MNAIRLCLEHGRERGAASPPHSRRGVLTGPSAALLPGADSSVRSSALLRFGESAPTYTLVPLLVPYWPLIEPLSEFLGPLLSVIPEWFQESSQATCGPVLQAFPPAGVFLVHPVRKLLTYMRSRC